MLTDLQPLNLPGVGSGEPIIIAGPCSAETHDQVLETARRLKKIGINNFRAGIWKPRTQPGGFEGVGEEGLAWLKEVKEKYGMAVGTEVANRHHVEKAIEAGVDLLWIGARTSANPFAMQEIADTLAEHNPENLNVLVKNPVNPDPNLWAGALQRIYNAGVRHLGGIHRGFSTDGKHIYRNPPQWHIPIELRLKFPNLPIICDPSHIGGKRELIAPLSQQAFDMGFDGLIIESHCNPDEAWSDAAQQVLPEILSIIINTLVSREQKISTESIALLRQSIDGLDNDLLDVLARRMKVSRDIGRYKKEHRLAVVQAGRYNDVLRTRIETGVELGMSAEFLRAVFMAIHEESVRQQVEEVEKK